MNRKMSIGTCIKLTVGVVLALLLVITVINVKLRNQAADLGDQLYNEYGKTQGEVGLGLAHLRDVKCNIRNVLYVYEDNPTRQQESIEALEQSETNLYDSLGDAENGLTDKEALERLEEAYAGIEKYLNALDECVRLVQAGNLDAAVSYFVEDAMALAGVAEEDMQALISRLDEAAVSKQDEFTSTQKWAEVIVFALLIVSFIIGFAMMFFLSKQIRKPIVSLAQASGKVALGEIDVALPEKCDLAEIEDLANAFRQMIENLKQQAEIIHSISDGDLSGEIRVHSERDAVGSALNKLLYDNNHSFKAIRNATNQISLGSSQIAAASQTLAQGSTQQASAIEQIVASVSDIADKTKNNASEADEVHRIVLQAKEDVTAGNSRMSEMVVAMNEINEASENIQKIIKVIDDIAFNTNILALNATVEAARAGEQGKGFAVVAEEVRNLAGRSAEASSQTAEMIEDSIRKVKRGGELAKETADALRVISEMIEKITDLSEDIAKASNDQATATAQIDQALMQVSQVVQTNSATSQQCASASEELSGQASGLNQELSRFRLKDVIGNMPSQTLEYSEPDVQMLENNMKY